MVEDQKEAGKPSLEVSKEEYFKRIPETEARDLERIGQLMAEGMRERQLEGAMFVVGGSITKPWPRKDIDALLIFEDNNHLPKLESYPTRYRYSMADFELLRGLVKEITTKDPQFEITDMIEPAIDEEFRSESILKHDGSITLKTENGTPIEIVRSDKRGVPNFTPKAKEPYVILARNENT